MSTLPNMSIVLPALGGDSGSWDDKLNDALTLVDSHDHTSGAGVQVPSAGLNIDADLSFGGFTISSLGKLSFTAITAPVSGSKNLFVNTSDNELYWRSNGGTNVKLTSGTSINTTLVGGIVGDYTSVGAAVAYDDANDRYTFKQQSGTWARLASGDVRLYETGTSESVYVGLKAPGALAASYDITMPLAVPSTTGFVRMSSGGVLSVGDAMTRNFPGNAASVGDPANETYVNFQILFSTSTTVVACPCPLYDASTVTGWSVSLRKTSAAGTITAIVYDVNPADGTSTQIGSTKSNGANNPGYITLSETGLSYAVPTGHFVYINIVPGGTNGDRLNGWSITASP